MAEDDQGKIIHLQRKSGEGSVPRRPTKINLGDYQPQFDAERIALEEERKNAATGLLLALLYPEQHTAISEYLQTLDITPVEYSDEERVYSLPQETFLRMETLPLSLSQANLHLEWEQYVEDTDEGVLRAEILRRTPTQEEATQARRSTLARIQAESGDNPIIDLERIRQQPDLPEAWLRVLEDEHGNFQAADVVVLRPRTS